MGSINIKYVLIFIILLYTTTISCNSKPKSAKASDNLLKIDTLAYDKIDLTKYNKYKVSITTMIVDTLETDDFWGVDYAYDIYNDTMYYIGYANSLYLLENGQSKLLSKLPIFSSVLDLFVFDDFIAITIGDLNPNTMYLFDKPTYNLIDSFPNFQIRSKVKENVCILNNLTQSSLNFNYCLFNFDIMDTIFVFSKQKHVTFLQDKYYVFDENNVDVYYELNDIKCFEFEKKGYYNLFGYFNNSYFGMNKQLIYFYKEGQEIQFETSLNNQKIQILNDKLYVYGWSFNEGVLKLLRYEISVKK